MLILHIFKESIYYNNNFGGWANSSVKKYKGLSLTLETHVKYLSVVVGAGNSSAGRQRLVDSQLFAVHQPTWQILVRGCLYHQQHALSSHTWVYTHIHTSCSIH